MRHIKNLLLLILLLVSASCKKEQLQLVVVVHVVRDPKAQFAERLRQKENQFARTKPQMSDGRGVMIATNEGGPPFAVDLPRLLKMEPEMIIVNSESELPSDVSTRRQMGEPTVVCGEKAYVPSWVSGQKREATGMFLAFLKADCT